jgi:hypothetical protein
VKKRILFALEELLASIWIAQWPSLMPDWFVDIWSGVWLVLINAVRRVRFGVHTTECEQCGMAYPQDDLHPSLKSDGNTYPECTSCARFGDMIRAIHPTNPMSWLR